MSPASTPPQTPAERTFHSFSAVTIDGEILEMSRFRGMPVLVVNTATQCAFTPQLRGLESLHRAFSPHGFSVLGFPSDQFHQDPGTDEDTREACTPFDVSFPLFSKIDVNGPHALPLWSWMRRQKGGVLGGRIAWNFTKFLIDADGRVLRRFAPPVPPARIAYMIEGQLGLEPGSTELPQV
ncbi:glutathione peroxidase [Brachybacterium sp. DNPG3]